MFLLVALAIALAIAGRLQGDCKYSNLTVRQKQSKPIGIAPCMYQKGVGSTIEEIAISGCMLGSGWVGSGDTDEI